MKSGIFSRIPLRSMDSSLLSPEQAQAVLQKESPLLVLAAAGTEKTRAITHRIHRIARLIEESVPPQRILAVTFMNKAAEELSQRVESLAPGRGNAVWIHTFRGFCAKLLQQHYGIAKVSRYFTIYDQSDQNRLIADAMKECGFEREAAKASCVLKTGVQRNSFCATPRLRLFK